MLLIFHHRFLPKLTAHAVALAAALLLQVEARSSDGFTIEGDNGAALHVIDSSLRWLNTTMSLSGDGSTVVGMNTAGEAVSWTAQTGVVSLGTLGGDFSRASDVSANGSVVVGWARTAEQTTGSGGKGRVITPSRHEAFVWTAETGMVSLGVPPGGEWSRALGVSADGNVVAGNFYNGSHIEPFVWTPETGMFSLGTLNDGRETRVWIGNHRPISADGTTVIGDGRAVSSSHREGFIWTAAEGMISTGPLEGARSVPSSVSADGSFVIGNNPKNFGWTPVDGIFPLSDMEDLVARALGVSVADDWSTVVGDYYPGGDWSQTRAFAWLALQGNEKDGGIMFPLDDEDFANSGAFPISADGSRIAGSVWNGTNYPHDYKAVFWDGVSGELQFLEDKLLELGVDAVAAGFHLADPWWGISADGEVLLGVGVDLLTDETRVFVAVLSNEFDPGDDDSGDDAPGDDDPGDDDPMVALLMVDGVVYADVGPRGRHLEVSVGVSSDDGPLSGAAVTATLHNLSTGDAWDFADSTDGSGVVTFRRTNAPSGLYALEIRAIDHPDYEWDGQYDDPGHQR